MSEGRHEHSQKPDSQSPDSHGPDSQVRAPTGQEPLDEAPAAVSNSGSESASETGGLFDLATDWIANAGSRVTVMVELVLAEARLAAISVALMAFLAMMAAAFVLGAWALLIAGLVVGLIQLGLPVWPVLLVLCAAHGLVAYLAWRGAVKLSDNLEFPVTRQQIKSQMQSTQESSDEETNSATES